MNSAKKTSSASVSAKTSMSTTQTLFMFLYIKNYVLGQSIQKVCFSVLEREALRTRVDRCKRFMSGRPFSTASANAFRMFSGSATPEFSSTMRSNGTPLQSETLSSSSNDRNSSSWIEQPACTHTIVVGGSEAFFKIKLFFCWIRLSYKCIL